MPRIAKEKINKEPVRAKKIVRFSRLRGMKDVLFDEYRYWDLITKKATDLADVYDFRRIDTPILEKLDLYERSTGSDTDVVSKEMYSFIDKSEEKVALRPEATPGIVRSYIEHGLFNQPQPIKTFWLGPLFRHEKPQSGRTRQHSQINFDVFGEAGPITDAQLILITYNFYTELQIDVQVQINSIGCPDCRKEYINKLTEYYKERGKRSRLCNDCKRRFVKNPLRLLDCKEKDCIEVREDAPQIVDFLCEGCREHFIKVLEYLDELGISYNLNPFLVRGLDYYTRTVFEIVAVDDEGEKDENGQRRQSSLGGGGRYDNLIEMLGGRPTPACGFGLGVERAILKIKEKNIPLKEDKKDFIFLAQLGEQARLKAVTLFEEMRRAGYRVRQAFTKDSLKAQLEIADRIGAKYSLILGQKELLDGTIIIRDMESGTQEVIDQKKIYVEINKRLEMDKGGN
ncbi:MAG: Histidine-tRNA ligase [Candidatus Falkowbacteria bacterium GW2011_GWC2_38_22]|uniref:Histidine--tRNA ligase n=1 Tax=Candidatus Falkowbacteria bacterium GW2011_GWE1_38_31 TaxID=1618638 RepID=A0A0G0K6Z6_9BACT|nr:MAG: Histidine-tRNA ligase [Candidatus Falkowbacteria bacterium GW2011_GWF2_38_1205]KKQ61811.1 MAG: Histidine-tRNA ligase [Candidatus Falkowbacteria bacterium GW2011_GWC2_38_22]KKQ64119.1 MAG: Histidine-tRNA ligase [Candidatus Falkowbacteria bacterium GW2011_GWF1_38_22]KKQ66531.1 MAG: Histidine-tRNA ligase [Candidatus Falkowbacteria bacterium GW2011_GWE2_38_254]KKQ71225.1 MAG: Histidine-tRNA ligase [Candidatus Falkowbacteria bacterium GW2011_GWE1_38_31]KKQ73353.1 MAG: Histidine-tRNA ligase 